MAAVTLTKRAVGKAHVRDVPESDTALLAGLELSAAGGASLYTDANTTSIMIGSSGITTTVASQLQVNLTIFGPSDGTGIVIGATGASASTGSALQVQSYTTTQRNNLVAANGMMIYNSSAGTLQMRVNSRWENVPDEALDATAVQPGIVSLGTLIDYPSSGGSAASEIQYTRVYLIAGVTYDEMQVFVDSGGSGTRNINAGIYDQATPASTTGTPNSRVAQTGTTNVPAGDNGTFKTVALTAAYTVPTTGYYWLALIPDSANLKFATSAAYRASFLPVRREAGAGSTLPATAGTLTNPSSAVIWTGAVEQ
jgi:hypothetical protein